MLSISHSLTGAFIASKVQNPILYIPLVLASHYIEDWILHWDVGTGLSNGTRKKSTAILLEIGDLILSVLLVYWLFQAPSNVLQIHAWVGAFMGLLPDFVEAPRNFLKYNPWWLKPFNDFHHGFHHSTPNMLLGLAPQVVVFGLILLLR
ncbi:hypothetical protein KBD71_01050 [Candidatus Woesebacteria bacterium]|nr:hypothetical protein [Candidatus Woesebacteria bacterium]